MNPYRTLLAKLHGTLTGYAENHRAKVRPGGQFDLPGPAQHDTITKAETNEKLAAEIAYVLDTTAIDDVYAPMVTRLKKPGEAILAQMTPEKCDAIHMAGAAMSEGGELFDAVKRWVFFNKPLDRTNVIEELGDLEFYMEGLRQLMNISREETLEANMAKLGQRYEGHVFSDAATIARADKERYEGAVHYSAELRDLPESERYRVLQSLMPASSTPGDYSKAIKRLEQGGIAVPR